jgi:hypothetical protein
MHTLISLIKISAMNCTNRIAIRLARADTGTPVTEWLAFPVVDLPEWCDRER